jgi:type 1 fimbriae regulatory protein FimB/type 1 fimbriae regulatory protein FimE
MVQAARKSGRHRIRDAAIILMMFRHGLRTAELVALRWQQIDLKAGYLDVHRLKQGQHAKHPLRGPQLRLLRELQRTYPDSPYVFVSERKAPLSPRSIREIVARVGKLAGLPFVPHPHKLRHACGYYLASCGHDTAPFRIIWGIKTSSIPCATRRWRLTALKTSGTINHVKLHGELLTQQRRQRHPPSGVAGVSASV